MSFVQEILLAASAYEQQINDDNIMKYFLWFWIKLIILKTHPSNIPYKIPKKKPVYYHYYHILVILGVRIVWISPYYSIHNELYAYK